jgi:hypothetical protein
MLLDCGLLWDCYISRHPRHGPLSPTVAPLHHNIRNSNLWSVKYNVYADQHRHITKKTTDSSSVYYDCGGATVGVKRSMAWMFAYIADDTNA